jgi:carbamate kinase
MLIVIALGGNALLQRGDPLDAKIQRKNVATAAAAIAQLAKKHQIVLCHGNGPQVGLLALQNAAYDKVPPYPLDILGAESQGMIGYLIQQELKNQLLDRHMTTLLTQIIVDQNDPAFTKPTKFIGPIYSREQAEKIAQENNWQIAPDGNHWRRVVPSPQPTAIVELAIAKTLIQNDVITIFGGGGGIPVINTGHRLEGVEAVIDKDNTAAFIATELQADALIILTDVDAACINWGTKDQKAIKKATPQLYQQQEFASGSMGPKINAACKFAAKTGQFAAIGSLNKLIDIIDGSSGTHITANVNKIEYYE